MEYAGTLRIKNPKTLRKWEDSGKLARHAERGYIYAKRCGRFVDHICHCSKCRMKAKGTYYGKDGWFEVSKKELEHRKILSQMERYNMDSIQTENPGSDEHIIYMETKDGEPLSEAELNDLKDNYELHQELMVAKQMI